MEPCKLNCLQNRQDNVSFIYLKIFFYHIDNINLLAFHKTIERTAVRNKSIQMAIIGYVHVEKQEASNTADNTFAA